MHQTFNPKNKDLLVNINGKLVHRDEAGISPFDSSVQNGDAVWEGLRLYNGRIFKLTEHLDRLRSRRWLSPMPTFLLTKLLPLKFAKRWLPIRWWMVSISVDAHTRR